jgi:glycosyltransferase involved in cell wall biosynthesis
MPEVAGDAALLVDPNQVEEIAAAMRRVADDPALARELGDRGKRRAAQFTWERCARDTWALYQEALRDSR